MGSDAELHYLRQEQRQIERMIALHGFRRAYTGEPLSVYLRAWMRSKGWDPDHPPQPQRVVRAMGEVAVVHGKSCPKSPHTGDGYLHDEGHDAPYPVDGVKYCGRCHVAMGEE